MKTIPKLASLLAALVILPATQSKAAEVSVDLFYDNLDSYGDWVEVGDYGYCWSPRDVGDDWRPYTAGNWAYTDAGWTWVSDEPYGWAVYHYGRWTRVDRAGWAWVPGTEWGPAWVSWRNSDRYVGWAPLPPESRVSVGVSIGRLGGCGVRYRPLQLQLRRSPRPWRAAAAQRDSSAAAEHHYHQSDEEHHEHHV
jgi:hypothetical protein